VHDGVDLTHFPSLIGNRACALNSDQRSPPMLRDSRRLRVRAAGARGQPTPLRPDILVGWPPSVARLVQSASVLVLFFEPTEVNDLGPRGCIIVVVRIEIEHSICRQCRGNDRLRVFAQIRQQM